MRRHHLLITAGLVAVAFFATCSPSYAARGGRVGPRGGMGAYTHGRAYAAGPYGGAWAGAAGRGTYTTARGGTINYAGAGAKGVGPYGGRAAHGVDAAQVTTAGGKTFDHVGRAGAAVGPDGRAAAGREGVNAVSGPDGRTAVGAYQGGVATGPGGTVAGREWAGAAAGPYGAAGAGYGPAAGYRYYGYRPGGYAAYPNAWRAGAYWAAANGVALPPVYPVPPVYYPDGSPTVIYQGPEVNYPGQPAPQAPQDGAQGQQQ
jgi:hypothetical protein